MEGGQAGQGRRQGKARGHVKAGRVRQAVQGSARLTCKAR
jgi:hypothetical protein